VTYHDVPETHVQTSTVASVHSVPETRYRTSVVSQTHVVPQTHMVTHDLTTVHEVASTHTAYHDVVTGYHQVPIAYHAYVHHSYSAPVPVPAVHSYETHTSSTEYALPAVTSSYGAGADTTTYGDTTTTPEASEAQSGYGEDQQGSTTATATDADADEAASYNADGVLRAPRRRLQAYGNNNNKAAAAAAAPVAYHPPLATANMHYATGHRPPVAYVQPAVVHSHAYSQSYQAVVTYRPQSVVYTMTQHLVCSPRVHVEYSCPACHNGHTYAKSAKGKMDDYGAWLTPKEASGYHYKTHVYQHVYHGGKRHHHELRLAAQSEKATAISTHMQQSPVLLIGAGAGTLVVGVIALFIAGARRRGTSNKQTLVSESKTDFEVSCQI